jgi:tripartite-type tricarboxylate transporter receptor subunit TctC
VKDKLGKVGASLPGGSPQAFHDYIDKETKKWAKVIKDAGVPTKK